MKYVIITGTSRGLGEAIAEKFMEKDTKLFCISRKKNVRLIQEAKEKGVALNYYEYDLNHVEGIETLMQKIFSSIDKANAKALYLVNNAGVLAPIAPIEKINQDPLIQNMHVNLIAPMLFVSQFMQYSKELFIEKRIINISSGAGKKPYYGWGCYCASKAGLDLFTRCVAVEEQAKDYPVKILSLAPGIMDTAMQEEIRATKEEDFEQVQRFIDFKEKGELLLPETVANIIVDLLERESFDQGAIIDVRDLLNK